MFKKLKVKIKKEEPEYELPNRPMDEWTFKEIKEICKFYGKNHEKCPFCVADEVGGEFATSEEGYRGIASSTHPNRRIINE